MRLEELIPRHLPSCIAHANGGQGVVWTGGRSARGPITPEEGDAHCNQGQKRKEQEQGYPPEAEAMAPHLHATPDSKGKIDSH